MNAVGVQSANSSWHKRPDSVKVFTLDSVSGDNADNENWVEQGEWNLHFSNAWNTSDTLLFKEEVTTTKVKFELKNNRHNEVLFGRTRFYVHKDDI